MVLGIRSSLRFLARRRGRSALATKALGVRLAFNDGIAGHPRQALRGVPPPAQRSDPIRQLTHTWQGQPYDPTMSVALTGQSSGGNYLSLTESYHNFADVPQPPRLPEGSGRRGWSP